MSFFSRAPRGPANPPPWYWRPRQLGPNGDSPYDTSGELRNTRPRTGIDIKPYPPIIGSITGILPLYDRSIMIGGVAKTAAGPGSGVAYTNGPQLAVFYQLPKQGG